MAAQNAGCHCFLSSISKLKILLFYFQYIIEGREKPAFFCISGIDANNSLIFKKTTTLKFNSDSLLEKW